MNFKTSKFSRQNPSIARSQMGQLLTTDPNLNGRVYKVKEKKSKDSTGERVVTLLHLKQYLPNRIMNSNQNHIIVDDMNNEVVYVI